MAKVSFRKDGKIVATAEAKFPQTIRDVALDAKVNIYGGIRQLLNCHGNGRCGSCKVKVDADNASKISAKPPAEHHEISDPEIRKACQAVVLSDVVVDLLN